MEKEDFFNEDKAMGDNGETPVKFLIKSMPDWECIKFGVENYIEDLKKIVRKEINPITKKIKSMPDFVAFNKKTGETFFIEVKYRSNTKKSKYILSYLEEYNEYWEGTKLIIVRPNEPYFVYIDLEKINPQMKRVLNMGQDLCREYWNFEDIEQDIQELFPDLSDEAINTAIKMIPNKDEN